MIRLRMIIYHILLFCFLSALCGGNSGLVDANPIIFTGPEGGNGTVTCSFNEFAKWKFFCRGKCKENGILIKTDAASANYGRYRIRYKAPRPGKSTLTVIITNLVQSDAGRYSCGLGSTPVPDSLQDFDVKVSDGLLNKSSDFVLTNAEGQDIESPCRDAASRSRMFFCRGKCKNQEDILIETDQDKAQNGRYGIEYKNGSAFGQYVTITKAVKSDSGEYTCGYGRVSSPDSSYSFLLLVDTPATAQPNTTLQPFATSATPNNPTTTTTQSLMSSSGSSTPSPAFTKSMRQTSPAAPTTSAPITTQSLIFSSRGSASPSVFPKTSNQPTAAAPTKSKPNTTLHPFATSVPTASTPNNPTTASQGLMSSSGSSTPSPAFTKSMRQTSPAAPTTSAPPTTQRFSSSSGSPTSSPVFPKTTNQPEAAGLLSPTSSDAPSRVLPVAVSVPVVGVALLSGFLMYLRKIKKFLE